MLHFKAGVNYTHLLCH